MPYTFVNNGGSSSSVSTGTLSGGTVTLTRYDEAGAATADTFNVAGYTVNNVTIANGTGANDSVVGSTGNDLFVWDDFALDSGARATANGASRYGWNRGSSNAHIEDWFGGAGDDVFSFTSIAGGTAMARATTIYGGTGNDVVWEDSGSDTVFGDADSDTVYGASGSDVLGGDSSLSRTTSGTSDGLDFLYGGSGTDTLYGAGAADSLFGGTGVDTVYGGDGDDRVVGDDSASTTTSGASDGSDVLYGDAGSDAMFGAGGNDTLYGGNGSADIDTVYGGDGNDLVMGDNSASTTTSSTTDGADILYGDAGTDRIYGNGGADTGYGGDGTDTLYGGDGNDALRGDAATDTLFGDAGDDTLDGGAGADVLDGGAGTNYAAYTSATAGVELDLAAPANNLGDAAGDTYANIDGYIGSNFNDTMWGSSGGDLEYGGLGDDHLEGGAGGADTLYGGDGNDFMSGMYSTAGGGAPDTLYGDAGDDTMLFSNEGSAVLVSGPFYGWSGEASGGLITLSFTNYQDTSDHLYGGSGFDTVDASRDATSTASQYIRAGKDANLDWIMSAEFFIASNNADVVNLSYANSTGTTTVTITDDVTVTGMGGSDVIVSGSGHDVLIGGSMTAAAAASGTADTIWGGDGNDTVWGDDYGDSITGTGGEGGNDTLYGADGDDTVLSQGGSDLSYGGFGNDVIWSDQGDWGLTTSSVMGNDTIYGGDGDDYILDLGGRNSISVTTSNDLVYGGIGNDVISVFAGNDLIDAGTGNDVIWGGSGNDSVSGGDGEDYIYGGAGTDTLVGGNGADYYYFSRSDGSQLVNEVSGEGAVNHLVVFGTFWETSDNSTPPQMLTVGSGIHETDVGEVLSVGHVLGNHSDAAAQTGNVNVTYNSATSITVSVTGGGSITFNPLLFADITLWNHDATVGQQMQEFYTWDANARGAGLGGFEFVAYIG